MAHVQLKFAKTLLLILGVWPVKAGGYKVTLYNTYFYASFCFYALFVTSEGLLAFVAEATVPEVARNLGITILFATTIYKVLVIRSQDMVKIVDEIEMKEKLILENSDEEIKGIYYKHVRSALLSARYYVSVGSLAILLYFITPIVKNLADDRKENKYLIFSSWLPFKSDEHYRTAYALQFSAGFYGYAYYTYTAVLLFGIVKYCIGQLKILQHLFKNLNRYSFQFSQQHAITERHAQEVFTKLCIKEHQNIISLVARFDDSMKTFMLLEFIISSFQLSLVLYQILQSSGFGLERTAVSTYFITICSQLSIFYWNAQQLIIESTELGQAVIECDWYKLDLKIQRMLIFVIQRAQKPIGISIGSLYRAKIDTLIGIYKAIYSYVAVIQKN